MLNEQCAILGVDNEGSGGEMLFQENQEDEEDEKD
jgi:hypothetical protein